MALLRVELMVVAAVARCGRGTPEGEEGSVMNATGIGTVPANRDKWLLRLGTASGALGILLELAMGMLHAGHTDPNDSATVFLEYAVSDIWTAVHIGQFFGAALIGLSLLTLAYVLAQQDGVARAFASVGALAAITVIAVFAVQMAVDGVALKSAVDDWVSAPASEKTVAFRVANGIRDVEKGLSGFFQIANGIALLGLGLAVALARGLPRWLGVVGALAGVGALIGGWATAHTGFSMDASRFSLPTVILLAVFVLGVSTLLWRHTFTDGHLEETGLA